MKYDIIGDIHGCAKTLTALLEKLGYELKDGIYQHTNNKVIFLGDFIDGSTPFQREVIHIVKNMVKSNNALSVMGNHEFNAIAYATKHPVTGEYLRLHNKDNNEQHKLFLDEFENNIDDYNETITWFKSLPLWLSLDGINIIHACWDPKLIKTVLKVNLPFSSIVLTLFIEYTLSNNGLP